MKNSIIITVCISFFVLYICYAQFPPFLPVIAKPVGINEEQVGIILRYVFSFSE